MKVGRLSRKGQVTLPKELREIVGLSPGDLVVYSIDNGQITIKRLESFDTKFHNAVADTLEEWGTSEDDEAFNDL